MLISLGAPVTPAGAAFVSRNLGVTAEVAQSCTVAIAVPPDRIAASCQSSAGAMPAPSPVVTLTPDDGSGAQRLTITF